MPQYDWENMTPREQEPICLICGKPTDDWSKACSQKCADEFQKNVAPRAKGVDV